jgi:hypothetical protein
MKIHTITSLLCLASAVLPVKADTFIMKDGTKLEGTILRQDPTSYVVEVQVTKTIKDERTLAKADVVKVEQEKLDLKAFEDVAKLVPVPDMVTAEEYAARIAKVEKFLVDHRGSAKSKEARAILATIKAEAEQIQAGGTKMSGKIVPSAEYRANAYDFDARIQEARIRALVKDGQTLMTLRAFREFDREFQSTAAYAAVAPVVIQVINAYLRDVEQLQVSFEARTKERMAGLERMSTSDRSATERAISEEAAALVTRLKQEKDANVGWVTTHPFFKPALDETLTFGRQELTRIGALKNAAPVDGGKIFRDALALIQAGGGDKTAVASSLAAAETAKVGPKYIALLKAAAQAKGFTKP